MKKSVNMNTIKYLFWDVDKENIDFDKYKIFIIGRVLDIGTWEDIWKVFEYYGKKEIKKAIVEATGLRKKTESFWSQYFDISIEHFRSWKKRETNPVKSIF